MKVAFGLGIPPSTPLLVVPQVVLVRNAPSRKMSSELSFFVDFVNSNPSAFVDAYFDFAWLNIYQ